MLKFYAQREWRGNRVAISISDERGESHSIAKPITFEVIEEGLWAEPAMFLKVDEAQCLMDTLWDAGLRPSEGSGSAGAMLATQNHLADMRKLVAKHLDVPL